MTDDKINIAELAHVGRTGKICADIAERVIADLTESRAYALALEQELRDRASLTAERDAALAWAVKVKPLVWAARGLTGEFWASTLIGLHYIVTERGWGVRNDPDAHPVEGGIEAAKAAAQADYEARILAAIQPDPEARQADLARAFCMGRDAAANEADEIAMGLRDNEYGDCADGAEEAAAAIRAMTPPADLAAKIGGE